MRLRQPHRWALPSHKLILVKPNRMLGLVEASAWMHVRNGSFKISLLLGSEAARCQSFGLLLLLTKKKAKSPLGRNTKAIQYQTASISADEPSLKSTNLDKKKL